MNKNRFPCHLNFVISLIISIFFFLTPTTASAAIQIITKPGVAPSTVQEIQKTVDAFNLIMRDTLNVSWQSDVRIVVCPDLESFLSVTQRELKYRRSAKESVYAEAYVASQTIFVDESDTTKMTSYERAETIGGFLFQLLSYQLNEQAAPRDSKVATKDTLNHLYWMDKGMSNYVGALVSEKRGLRSIAKWKHERILELRGLYMPMSLHEVQILYGLFTPKTLEVTQLFSSSPNPRAHYKADLAVIYLLETSKVKVLKATPTYYQRSADKNDIISVWESAYGLKYEEFMKNLVSWYNRKVLLL